MARLVFRHSEVVLGFRSSIRFGIANQQFLKALDGLFKVFEVELYFPSPENHLTNEVLWRQKTDESMMFIPIGIQDDNGWSPIHAEAIDQGLILVEINLKGDETLRNRKADIGIGVGNSFQLLAAYSKLVIKIDQDQLFLLLCLRLSRCQGRFPLWFWHDPFPPLFE